MRELEQITDDEMIYAFIRAEADAPRWAMRYQESGLQPGDSGPNANPNDVEQNRRRRNALASARGYGQDQLLFRGLPSNMAWHRVVVTVDELAGFQHLKYGAFIQLTGGSRLVRDGAKNAAAIQVQEGLSEWVLDLAQAVSNGERHPPLIAVAPGIDATPVILEGNTRASAYVRELPPEAEIEIILGVAPGVTAMTFF
jgi:hypothetical protein